MWNSYFYVMQKTDFYVIGLMSGTSLDGVDLVYVRLNKVNYADFEIVFSKTYGYSKEWKKELQEAITFSKEKQMELDNNYGLFLGEVINEFIHQYNIVTIDFIASHGHTVFHQPDKGITLQIGNGQEIANVTKQKVVCDFRSQDVALGGQGAPLVPVGDKLLFANYDYCLNLGGFANVSFDKEDERIAFDICPVNIVLNKYANELGYDYDDKGHIAKEGNYLKELDLELRSLNYYKKVAPKSLGLEWVQKEIFPVLEASKRKPEDLLRTFVEHAAWALAEIFPINAKVLITGGGVYNEYLLSRINFYKKINIIIPDDKLIGFKEALIFAFLGVLRVDNQVNCFQSVTGAKRDHSSGVIFNPNN